MFRASAEAMTNGTVLGYVTNALKSLYKTFIVHYENDYYVVASNWELGQNAVYRKLPKSFSTSIKFDSEKDMFNWWRSYQRVLKSDVHIYI